VNVLCKKYDPKVKKEITLLIQPGLNSSRTGCWEVLSLASNFGYDTIEIRRRKMRRICFLSGKKEDRKAYFKRFLLIRRAIRKVYTSCLIF